MDLLGVLTFYSLAVTICITSLNSKFPCPAHSVHYLLFGSYDNQHLFPFTALKNWFL